MSTQTTTLTAGASYDLDWHVYITDPVKGPLGYCIGSDGDFEPEAASAHLAAKGWRVVGSWTETPLTEDYQYVATVVPTGAATV